MEALLNHRKRNVKIYGRKNASICTIHGNFSCPVFHITSSSGWASGLSQYKEAMHLSLTFDLWQSW